MIGGCMKKGCLLGCLFPLLAVLGFVAVLSSYLVWLNVSAGSVTLGQGFSSSAQDKARVAAALLQTDLVDDKGKTVVLQEKEFAAFIAEWSRGSPLVVTSIDLGQGVATIRGALDFRQSAWLSPVGRIEAFSRQLGPYPLTLNCSFVIDNQRFKPVALGGVLGEQALPAWSSAIIFRLAEPPRPRPEIHPRFHDIKVRGNKVEFLSD